MSNSNRPRSCDGLSVLVAGGGVAALEAAYALRALAGELVDIEILCPETRFYYRPQAVVEPFGGPRVEVFELAHLAASIGAQLTIAELVSVSPDAQVARTSDGMTISYDALLIASGTRPRPALPHALTFRGPADSDRLAAISRDAESGDISAITLAIPTQPTWPLPIYELAFGLRSQTTIPITIKTTEAAACAVLGRNGSSSLTDLLRAHGIRLETNADFPEDASTTLVIAAPILSGDRIYGIPADDDGFIPTNRLGAIHGTRNVYAAGDITTYTVKHGSLAAAQADTAAQAIAAQAGAAIHPTPFRPILHAQLTCASTSLYIRRDLENPHDHGTVSTEPLWTPAGKIFARHLGPALAASSEHRYSPLNHS